MRNIAALIECSTVGAIAAGMVVALVYHLAGRL